MVSASNEVVAVIQADRDMVQAFHRLRLNKLMEAIKDEKAGARLGEDEGDAGDLVQAFARHRIAHSDPRPVAEGLREALEVLLTAAYEYQESAREHISDTRYDEDGNLAERDAALAVVAIPDARAVLATHSPAPMAGEVLALRAIKAVTAAGKDGPKALSRIMTIASQAGIKAPYTELLADPNVALIVERPLTEWAHLFKPGAEGCKIPPAGWYCTRARGHTGPCAAHPSTQEGSR